MTGAEGKASGRILDGRAAAKLVGGLLVGALLVYHRLTSYWSVVAAGGWRHCECWRGSDTADCNYVKIIGRLTDGV